MIRFVNQNRMAAVGVAAAVVLVVVTMLGRANQRPDPGVEVLDASPNAPTTTVTAVPADETADEPGTERVVDAPGWVMPFDPSGARQSRSRDGAQQSAIDFAGGVQQRLLYLNDQAARDVLGSWSASSTDASIIEADLDKIAALRSTLTSGGGRVWWSVTPIASRLDAFDTDRARVSVWVVQVVGSDVDPQLGGSAVAPTVDFRTTVVDLVWDTVDGWSVWDTTSTPGPVPMMSAGSTMSAPTEFIDAIGDFTLTKDHS